MRLSDEERARMARRLDDCEEDATVASNVLETLYAYLRDKHASGSVRMPTYGYHIETTPGADTFVLQLKRGLVMFMYEYVRVVRSVARVANVALNGIAGTVDVQIWRHAVAMVAHEYVPPAHLARRRRLAIDFAASKRPPAPADCTIIDALVNEVYASVRRIPAGMATWYETIREHGSAEDASEMTEGGTGAPGAAAPAAMGYSICFTHIPAVSADFLKHLMTEYTAAIASMYMWFAPPASVADSPVFVVNVRAAATPVAATKLLVANNVPRGGVTAAAAAS